MRWAERKVCTCYSVDGWRLHNSKTFATCNAGKQRKDLRSDLNYVMNVCLPTYGLAAFGCKDSTLGAYDNWIRKCRGEKGLIYEETERQYIAGEASLRGRVPALWLVEGLWEVSPNGERCSPIGWGSGVCGRSSSTPLGFSCTIYQRCHLGPLDSTSGLATKTKHGHLASILKSFFFLLLCEV